MKQQTVSWWAIVNRISLQAIQPASQLMRQKYMRVVSLGLVFACLFGILFSTDNVYASKYEQSPPSIIEQERLPFHVEMFPGEHMSIPGKTIAAKIEYFNDPETLNGIDLENAIITAVIPDSSYFNADESDAGWACDENGAEGDSCHFIVGTLSSGESGSLRFAATMYANDTEAIVVDEIALVAGMGADNLPESAASLFQNDLVIGMSAPTDITEIEEPVQNFQIFLPMIVGW